MHEEATTAAMAVIEASTLRTAAVKKQLSRGQAAVQRNVLHSPVALLEQHAAKEAAAAARVADCAKKDAEKELQRVENEADRVRKAATKTNNTCRACQKKTRRSCGRWAGCPCGAYWVCPECRKDPDAYALLGGHVSECVLKIVGAGGELAGNGGSAEEEE